MCQLLGLSFNQTVDISLSFRGFRHRGENNPDGWGLAYYTGNHAKLIKEVKSAADSNLAEIIVTDRKIKSKIFISHVRYSSVGSLSYNNTHPFKRRLFDKDFIFAHNGTLNKLDKFSVNEFKPNGETDSEHAFCYILEQIKKFNISIWNELSFIWLGDVLRDINKLGKFNCLMSDGEYLFCYSDKDGYVGLYFLKRQAPFETVHLLDEDYKINLAEDKKPDQQGYVIASSPLTNEKWELFSEGMLTVFKNGEIIYSG